MELMRKLTSNPYRGVLNGMLLEENRALDFPKAEMIDLL